MRLSPPQSLSLTGKECINFGTVGDGFNCRFSTSWENELFLQCLPDSNYQLSESGLGTCGQSDDMRGGKRNAWVLLTILAPEIRVRVTREACLIPVSLTKAPIQVPAVPSASLWNGIFQSPRKHSHSCVGRAPSLPVWLPHLAFGLCSSALGTFVSSFHCGMLETPGHILRRRQSRVLSQERMICVCGDNNSLLGNSLTTAISGTFLMTSDTDFHVTNTNKCKNPPLIFKLNCFIVEFCKTFLCFKCMLLIDYMIGNFVFMVIYFEAWEFYIILRFKLLLIYISLLLLLLVPYVFLIFRKYYLV